ncbi:MAG: YidC/Oxa1 family membrane protein insertase [Tissierellia bacterium]|nr:YidC/Oxa1 family membrane protein insertase [Tissierellia bacterium]
MTAFLGNIFGSLLKLVFDLVSQTGIESKHFSYYSLAIIITTILFKLILLPVSLHQSKSTAKMNELQPQIKKIQKKYKSDPQTQQAKLMELYKQNKYNPASGCIILLIQFPIIIAFFRVLREPITYVFKDPNVYAALNKGFLWIPNLEQPDPILWGLPLLAGLTTFLQTKLMAGSTPADPKVQSTQNTMNIILPFMIFWAARNFPSGLSLYWVVGNIFQVIQLLISNRSLGDIKGETR